MILAACVTYCVITHMRKAKLTAATAAADAKGVSTTTANPALVVRAVAAPSADPAPAVQAATAS